MASQLGTFLTHYELDTGKEDQHDTIQAREVIATERLEQQEGCIHLPTEVEQCMFLRSGPDAKKKEEDMKKVCQGAPIFHYERGLLETVLAKADYGESDSMDNHHTLFLQDLSDLQVYTNTILLEQVVDLVSRKTIRQLLKIA